MGLRDEIIESQKARADLFKWKIILVAAIGAAVFDVGDPLASGKAAGQAGQDDIVSKREYLLCLVPLVCVYTDILCAHMNLRIRVIGQFLREFQPIPAATDDSATQVAYENFVHKTRQMAKPSLRAIVNEAWKAMFGASLNAFVFRRHRPACLDDVAVAVRRHVGRRASVRPFSKQHWGRGADLRGRGALGRRRDHLGHCRLP